MSTCLQAGADRAAEEKLRQEAAQAKADSENVRTQLLEAQKEVAGVCLIVTAV